MQSQSRIPTEIKMNQANKRLARPSRHSKLLETPILELDEMEYLSSLADDPVYVHADRYHKLEPSGVCEEDIENAEAEITELFRCAGGNGF